MITSEWCRERAETNRGYAVMDAHDPARSAEFENYVAALSIAARVLDEGAAERLGKIISQCFRDRTLPYTFPVSQEDGQDVAHTLLAYLRGDEG